MIRVGTAMTALALAWFAAGAAVSGEPVAGAAPAAGAVELAGRVIGPDDKPVEGARVYLIRSAGSLSMDYGPAHKWPKPAARTVTGADGAFRFALSTSEASDPWPYQTWVLAAPAAGAKLGAEWAPVIAFDPSGGLGRRLARANPELAEWATQRREPVIRMPAGDVPLAGRVTTTGGAPVPGATVCVVEGWQFKEGHTLTDWLDDVERKGADYDRARSDHVEGPFIGASVGVERQVSAVLTATTDRAGAFRLEGLGRDRIVLVEIRGPGIQTRRVYARTRTGPTLHVQHDYAGGSNGEKFVFHGARFEHAAAPSVPVVGTIRDRDTGRPLAGVVVQSQQTAVDALMTVPERSSHVGLPAALAVSVTDREGRYRLTGLPAGRGNQVLAVAYDQPYLPAVRPVELAEGRAEAPMDFALKRGVWVRGRVTDARTGLPVWCAMHYFAFADTPGAKALPDFAGATANPFGTHLTDKDGRFALPGLPGAGLVTAHAMDRRDEYPLGAGAERIPGSVAGKGVFALFPTVPQMVNAASYNAVVQVDGGDGRADVVRDIRLDPGETVSGRVLDPDGRPLAGARPCGCVRPLDRTFQQPLPSDAFAVRQYFADHPRTVLFVHPERKLAGAALLRGPRPKSVEVRLRPWGVVTGRVVDEAGRPMAKVVLVNAPYREGQAAEADTAVPEHYSTTDKDGRFRVEGLAPGFKYNLWAAPGEGRNNYGQVVFDAEVKPGETRDLGDLRVKDGGAGNE